jgi:hypothetical protein
MSVSVNFNGINIKKPGSYSSVRQEIPSTFGLATIGIVALIGESSKGPNLDEISIDEVFFTPSRYSEVKEKYGSGPLVDSFLSMLAPSSSIENGVQGVYLLKTNKSTKASHTITGYGKFTSLSSGVEGNSISLEIKKESVILPSVSGLYYLPGASNLGNSDLSFVVNGEEVLKPTITGNTVDLISANIGALSGISSVVVASSSLFSGLVDTSIIEFSYSSSGNLILDLSTGAISEVNNNNMVVISNCVSSSFNGVYEVVEQLSSTSIVISKVKNISNDLITKVVAGEEILELNSADVMLNSKINNSFSVSIESEQDHKQGSSLQMSSTNLSRFMSKGVSIIPSSSQDISSVSCSVSSGKLLVNLINGNFVSCKVGEVIRIPSNSLLSGANWENVGLFIISKVNSRNSLELTKLGIAGSLIAVASVLVTESKINSILLKSNNIFSNSVISTVIPSSLENKCVVSINNLKTNESVVSPSIGGNVILQLGYLSSSGATSAVATLDQAKKELKLEIVGVDDASQTIDISEFVTLSQLSLFLESIENLSVKVDTIHLSKLVSILDSCSVDILSLNSGLPGKIKSDKYDLQNWMNNEQFMILSELTAVRGIPELIKTFLKGGSVGSTSMDAISESLQKLTEVSVNSIVPLFSRDSSYDIEDKLTDSLSDYSVDSIASLIKTHCLLMSNTINRNERNCILSIRREWSEVKEFILNNSSYRVQVVCQDILDVDSKGVQKFHQPYLLAAKIAGMRAGAVLGLPLTFKNVSISGFRQHVGDLQSAQKDVINEFNPKYMYDEGISVGLTFVEKSSSGYRLVLDNSSYSKDDNWVYNRSSTVHLSDILVSNFRLIMENNVVGQKNNEMDIPSITLLAQNILAGYNSNKYIASTSSSPGGYRNLSIKLSGNTYNISVTLVLAEGIDFVLSDFTLSRAE